MRAAQRTSSSSFGLGQVASGRLDDVPLPADPSPTLSAYAHPERLVTADWLSAHMGAPGLAIVESDEDVLLYDVGHIPGAVKIDWHTDLNDPRVRDYINGEQFAELMDRKGIARDDTVVIYGDKSNWWAAYALCSRCSVTPTCDSSTAAVTSGSPSAGKPPWTSRPRPAPVIPSCSATMHPSAHSETTCWPSWALSR